MRFVGVIAFHTLNPYSLFTGKKWMHLFHDQSAVVFIASLGDYRTAGEVGGEPGDALREAIEVTKNGAQVAPINLEPFGNK